MAVPGRSTLRDLFDDSPTPHIAHPPRTHRRQFYVATDGSYRDGGGGLGAVIEACDGRRVARVAVPDVAPDNNVAEYRALHLGLDVLAARAPPASRVGVVVDLDALAANVNRVALADGAADWTPGGEVSVPEGSEHHWRGVRARIAGFEEVRAATVDGRENPAHPLANAPGEFAHVNRQPERCVRPLDDVAADASAGAGESEIPPPSRAERRVGD
jgi:ribonuclease HI